MSVHLIEFNLSLSGKPMDGPNVAKMVVA